MSNFTFVRLVRRIIRASNFDWFVISSPEEGYDIFVSFYSEPKLEEGYYVINATNTPSDKGKAYMHIRENTSDKCALLIKELRGLDCGNIVIFTILASISMKDKIRYRAFCKRVCKLTGAINDYEHVTIGK